MEVGWNRERFPGRAHEPSAEGGWKWYDELGK